MPPTVTLMALLPDEVMVGTTNNKNNRQQLESPSATQLHRADTQHSADMALTCALDSLRRGGGSGAGAGRACQDRAAAHVAVAASSTAVRLSTHSHHSGGSTEHPVHTEGDGGGAWDNRHTIGLHICWAASVGGSNSGGHVEQALGVATNSTAHIRHLDNNIHRACCSEAEG